MDRKATTKTTVKGVLTLLRGGQEVKVWSAGKEGRTYTSRVDLLSDGIRWLKYAWEFCKRVRDDIMGAKVTNLLAHCAIKPAFEAFCLLGHSIHIDNSEDDLMMGTLSLNDTAMFDQISLFDLV